MDINLKSIAHILGGEVKGNQVLAPGPGHSAEDRSLSVTISNSGDDVIVHTFSPADDDLECKRYVREKCGIQFKPNGNGKDKFSLDVMVRAAMSAANGKPKAKPIAIYHYTSRDGTLIYDVLRFDSPKRFAHRLADGTFKGSERRVIYRWPDIIKYPDATIFITEGEKDADNVAALDLCATTVASGKWTDDCVNALAGRHCWILEDNDDAGRKKALEAATLLHPVAASIKIVRFPSLPNGGDVSDWLDMGHTKDDLEDFCCSAPDWEPGITDDDAAQERGEVQKPGGDRKSINVLKQNNDPTVTDIGLTRKQVHEASAPLCFVKIEDWLDRDPPPRDWAVPDRFPLRNVSLLSGEGSIGKTIVLMQLAAAHVFGRGWLDTLPEPGDAIYLNAEDEETELHRRFVDIARLYDTPLGELKDHLHVLAMAGQDAVLAHVNRHGLVKPTPLSTSSPKPLATSSPSSSASIPAPMFLPVQKMIAA